MAPPKKSKKGEGFQSAAGLIRYFDSESEEAVKISPVMLIVFTVLTVVVVQLLHMLA